jgi:hypothetical protein
MANPNPNDDGSLILGWQVDDALEPRYWLNPDAKAGFHSPGDLFMIPGESMEAHTVIIAQSGSGKSFFLGRLIEEMMLATKARALILDPNSDFRRVKEVQSASLWTNAKYDQSKKKAKLPHEKSRDEFSRLWSEIPMRVRTGLGAGPGYETLQVRWLSLSMEFLAEDVIDPMLRSDLYNCHAFVKELGELLRYKFKATGIATDLIDEAQWVFSVVRGPAKNKNNLRSTLESKYSADQILGSKAVDQSKNDKMVFSDGSGIPRPLVERLSERFINASLTISKYVSEKIQRFYFGKAREYQVAGILKTQTAEPPWHARPPVRRLEVVDLPSLTDRSTRLLAINAVLTTEWERARASWSDALEREPDDDERIPTFIVIDEAHNLIPAKPRSKPEMALREQFRTLSAEGRKYGLFLILVSQRPDKLDPLVLSECQNKALMKLGSKAVLKTTRRMLGLDELPEDLLDSCLEFETGRVLFAGSWSPNGPQVAVSAARRTTEGGRNLRPTHWAQPFGAETKKDSFKHESTMKRRLPIK